MVEASSSSISARPLPGHQAKAGFQRQIGNCLLPCFAGRLFVLLASRNAYIALDITDADDLRVGGIGIMLSQDEHGFLLQLFTGVAIENFLKLRQGLRFVLLTSAKRAPVVSGHRRSKPWAQPDSPVWA